MSHHKLLPPTHAAAIERLQTEGTVRLKDVAGYESRAMFNLLKKGIVRQVFQPYGQSYFELTGQLADERQGRPELSRRTRNAWPNRQALAFGRMQSKRP